MAVSRASGRDWTFESRWCGCYTAALREGRGPIDMAELRGSNSCQGAFGTNQLLGRFVWVFMRMWILCLRGQAVLQLVEDCLHIDLLLCWKNYALLARKALWKRVTSRWMALCASGNANRQMTAIMWNIKIMDDHGINVVLNDLLQRIINIISHLIVVESVLKTANRFRSSHSSCVTVLSWFIIFSCFFWFSASVSWS